MNKDTAGVSNVVLKAIAPNGKEANANFNVTVIPKKRISGKLVDYENNPRQGYVLLISNNNDSSFVSTNANGDFYAKIKPSSGDTLKAHIKNSGHNEAFIRKMYLAGANDKQNVNVDAIPALDDSVYIGLDTLASFAFEANFGAMSFEGLKKAKLDSLKEVISSQTTRYGFPDTIKAHEQVYIMNIIGQDTITNNRAIVQEGLSGRIAPGEVGYTSVAPQN